MNVSYRWLRVLAPGLDDDPDEVARRLAMYGAPVEAIERPGERLGDVLVGRVERVREHPNADRLRLCDVEAGDGGTRQVVCGAPVIDEGAFYPFAPEGATLPGGMEIRGAKIRGQESRGMLCSAAELELGTDESGLLELTGELRAGEPLVRALGLDDVRLELEITPNRPDLLSQLGVARELAPGGEHGLALPELPGQGSAMLSDIEALELHEATDEGEAGGVRVALEYPAGCPRYLGAVVRGVELGPSPGWLAARLCAVGLRPINNIVDATNYVLHELGQPLHAFDLGRLAGPEVRIRRAAPDEPITTLDGEERTLPEETTVIADAERPVAVAGVMGGEESEVTDDTRDIFLECALFGPKSTRGASGALGLSTDASFRFERGVDPAGMERALRRALSLIVHVAGGEVDGPAVDLSPERFQPRVVSVRPSRAEQVLGVPFDGEEIRGYLEPLGFEIDDADAAGEAAREPPLQVRVPGWRSYDVAREADLVEEVARRHGYGAFPEELGRARPSAVPGDRVAGLEDRLRSLLVGRGFLESRTAPFAPEEEGDVELRRPLSAEESRLRRALMPSLVRRVEHNFAHGIVDVRLFEIGTVFAPADAEHERPRESTHLAAAFTGASTPPHWSGEARPFDIWDLKGLMTEVGDAVGVEGGLHTADVGATHESPLHVAFGIVDRDGDVIGRGGRIAPDAVDAPARAGPVWALEFELRPEMAAREPSLYEPLPEHPAIERDLALLVPDGHSAGEIEAAIREAAGSLLEALETFDLYRGSGVPEGTRSIAYRLRFRAPERTLTDAEADEATSRVLNRLNELGVERRG